MPLGEWTVQSRTRHEMIDITDQVLATVLASGIDEGVCYLYNPHTTAGLTINEGADPDVQKDILAALVCMLPPGFPYQHREGNSPSHLMASLIGSSVTVLISQKRPQLGTWQRIFFCEFDGPRQRKVWWKILADK